MIDIETINGSWIEEIPIIDGAFFKIEEEFKNLHYAEHHITDKDYKYDINNKDISCDSGWVWCDSLQEAIIKLELNIIIKKWGE